jgi:hypothetical protein
MLALKKISIKKLAIYVSVIVLMLGGTGFMLYQNQRLTNGQASAIGDPARYNEFMAGRVVIPGGEAAPSQALIDPLKAEVKPSQPLEASKVINNQGIDLTIFSNEKFQELKENILIPQEDSGLGKRDPFKPN